MFKFLKKSQEKSFKTITESLSVMMQDLCAYADEQNVAIAERINLIEVLRKDNETSEMEKGKALKTASKLGEILS